MPNCRPGREKRNGVATLGGARCARVPEAACSPWPKSGPLQLPPPAIAPRRLLEVCGDLMIVVEVAVHCHRGPQIHDEVTVLARQKDHIALALDAL